MDPPTDANDDRNDPRKYIFHPANYKRIPRWPNDGIEMYRRECLAASECDEESFAEQATKDRDDPVQLFLTELLGVWPSDLSYSELVHRMQSGQESDDELTLQQIMGMPYALQAVDAVKKQNKELAKSHLIEAYRNKDEEVQAILTSIGATSALHKASKDPRRFPEMESIIVPLLQKNLATEHNIELLFGDVAHVRGLLLELGSYLKAAKPGTPQEAFFKQYSCLEPDAESKIKAAPKACDVCGTTTGTLFRCTGCSSVHYCSKDCQKAAWVVHRPDCFKAQGKPVSDALLAKAASAVVAKEKTEEQARRALMEKYISEFLNEDHDKVNETLVDCHGNQLKTHLPTQLGLNICMSLIGADLNIFQEEVLHFRTFPDGIDPKIYNFRGILFGDKENNEAKILMVYTHLYKSYDAGDCIAYAIDGIFVVDRVYKEKGKNKGKQRAWWKLVPAPEEADLPDDYNRNDWMLAYFSAAKKKAKTTEADIDLGIDSAGTPNVELVSTSAGNYVRYLG
ncbi:hypothetical protein MPSEU_000622300 [Mayamaea pseudoterrestris]|nr:hypothetical protein MPSEU_000622300 [Mayamaea pseudoterrestris]